MDHGSVAVGSHQGPVATHAPPGTTHAGSIVTHSGLLAGHGGPHASSHAANHSANHAGPDELEALLRTIGAEEAYAHAHQQMAPKPQLQQIAASGANTEPINIEKKHKCEYCPFGCNNSGDYKRHMRTHTGEKPFECDKCGAKFARSGHLKVHMKYHSGDKPHQCTQCPTSFVQAGDLKKHMRYHTGEKPYQCNQCQAKFIQLAGLKAHVRTHTGEKPFKCETCEKAFKTKTDLVIHERGHTGEKPYDCVLCPSKFLTSGHLRRHERSKHGENLNITSDTFQCKQCHSKFNSKTRLTLHVERYHGVPDNDNINPPLSLPPQHLPHMNMPVNNHLGMPVMMSPGFAMNSMAGGGPPHSAVSQSMMHGANTLPSMASSDASSMMSGGAGVVASTNMTPYPIMSNPSHFSYPSMASMMNPSLVSLQSSNLIPPASSQMLGYPSMNEPNVSQGYVYQQQLLQPEPPVPPRMLPDPPAPPKPKYPRRFFCTTCTKGFINAGDLEKHNRTHTGEKPFQCDECESCFTQASHLKTHKKYHSGERNHVCTECEKAFVQSYELKQHMRTHTGEKPYACTQCPKTFSQRNNLREHERLHTGEKPYKCDLCPAKFRASSGLWTHKLSHSTKEGIKNYKCMQCDGKYSTSSHLRRHERCHWAIPPKKHHCTECAHSYTRVDNLRLHVKKCHTTKPHHRDHKAVNSDSKTKPDETSTQENLDASAVIGYPEDTRRTSETDSYSISNVDNVSQLTTTGSTSMTYQPAGRVPRNPIDPSKRSYACGMCLKSFANAGDLEKHVRIHTGEKPFHCQQCPAKFAQAVHLKTHMRYHTGERPYNCLECPKAFFTSSELKRHSLTHSGEKPYKCTVCDACFARSITLAGHVRKHTGERPYVCIQCTKCFKTSEGLRIHKLTHSGERRHECTLCSSKFSTSSHLRRHERTHKDGNEIKLNCPHCTCVYTKQGTLKRHIKDVHHEKAESSSGVLTSLADSLTAGAKKRDTRVGSKKRKPAVVKRRFLCDQCGSTFQVAAKFKQHLEKVHQIEVISFDDMTTKSTRKRKAPKRKSTRPARVPANTQPDHPENEDGESVQPVDEPMDRANNETDLAGNETDPERPLTPSEDELDHTDRPVSPEHKVSGANAFEKIQITIEKPQGSSPTKMDVAFSPDAEDDYQSAGDEPNDTGNTENIEGRDESSETEEPDEPAETDQRAPAQLALYEQSDINQTERVVEPPASPDSIKQEDPTDPSDETDEQTGEYQPSESTGQMETDENITEQH